VTDRTLVLGLVAFSLALRLIAVGTELNPTFHPALNTVLFVHDLLRERGIVGIVEHWKSLFSSTQEFSYVQRSAVAFPISAAVQRVLGPSLSLPALVGALHSTVGVVLAWVIGRSCGGRLFGMLFAGFLAISPVQILWSRIGGLYIVCVPHVLLGMWCAQACARRRSIALALLTAAVAGSSVYSYFAARLLVPLGFLTLLLVSLRVGTGPMRLVALLAAFIAPLAAPLLWWHRGIFDIFWPHLDGGFVGEPTWRNLFAAAAERFASAGNWWATPRVIFWAGRLNPWERPSGWGIASGGMHFIPTLFLGSLGFALAIGEVRRHVEWVLLGVLGYFVAALSGAETRRLLPFDIAWSYYCALACVWLLSLQSLRRWHATLTRAVLGLIVGGGLWSLLAIMLLTGNATQERSPIPFGVGTIGEAITCMPCTTLSRRWRDRIRENEMVVLLDTDYERDARMFAMPLRGYGELAALEAGRPEGFVHFYDVWKNRRLNWTAGPIEYGAPPYDVVAHLQGVVTRTRPSRLSWYFNVPTQWERALAVALERSGSRREALKNYWDDSNTVGPSHAAFLDRTSLELVSEGEGIRAALDALAQFIRSPSGGVTASLQIQVMGTFRVADAPLSLIGGSIPGATAPTWVSTGEGGVGGQNWFRQEGPVAGAAVIDVPVGPGGPSLMAALMDGRVTQYDGDTRVDRGSVLGSIAPIGHGCVAYAGNEWWVVDPVEGVVRSSGEAGDAWIPREPWIGIAVSENGGLVLASAGQEVVELDVEKKRVMARFHAPIWPSCRARFGECSTVGAATQWYVTYDHMTGRAAFFDRAGEFLANVYLPDVLGIPGSTEITAVGAHGEFLGIGIRSGEDRIVTAKVSIAR